MSIDATRCNAIRCGRAGYGQPLEYDHDDPYDRPYEPLNNVDPYAADHRPVSGTSASASTSINSQMPASAMASSSSFNGASHHVVSDRSYIGPDGKWVRETFSDRDGDVKSNVYHEDDPMRGAGPSTFGATLNDDLHRRHRSKIDKIRAKQNKTMAKIAKRHQKMMRKHEQNMARAQAMAAGRLLF